MKIKLRKSDRQFTQIQRFRFDYTCQKCGRKYSEHNAGLLRNLGVSHYYGRSRENTRFDNDNVTLICNLPCHRKWGGEERGDYTEYMIERLGQKGFEELTERANTYKKRNDAETEEILQAKIKLLEEENMNKTLIPWVKNPDGSQGYTWNPITGCLNHGDGLCKGGGFPCYAYKLANGRLKSRYLANTNYAIPPDKELPFLRDIMKEKPIQPDVDPFYPRFWEERFDDLRTWTQEYKMAPRGIFVCDMSDLFGIGIPEEWTRRVLDAFQPCPQHRFYLLTKQARNLIKFSPFPDNCWVGVTATNWLLFSDALGHLATIKAKVKYISFEPLLERIELDMLQTMMFPTLDWVIIGAQTSPKKLPQWEWVSEIIYACDKAGIPIFLKNNLGLPKLNCDGALPFYKKDPTGTMILRQEMPTTNV